MSFKKELLLNKPPKITPLEVKVENGNFEDAFRKFKVIFQKERVVGQLKEREAFEKPSEKKRRKRRQAYERQLMIDARERMMKSGEWDRRQKRRQKKREQKLETRLRKQESTEDIDINYE